MEIPWLFTPVRPKASKGQHFCLHLLKNWPSAYHQLLQFGSIKVKSVNISDYMAKATVYIQSLTRSEGNHCWANTSDFPCLLN